MPAIEVLLPLGAVGFYLFDSVLRLYGNEIVFYRVPGGWGFHAGTEELWFRKRIYLPNPFTPHVPLWRAHWSLGRSSTPAELTDLRVLEAYVAMLWPLRVVVLLLLGLIVLGLPTVLATTGQGRVLVGLFALIYALDLFAVVWLCSCRRALGLSNRACIELSVDALACPPFAINLLRKLSLRQSLRGDPLELARPVFAPQPMSALGELLSRRVAYDVAAEPEGTARHQALIDYLGKLRNQTNLQEGSDVHL